MSNSSNYVRAHCIGKGSYGEVFKGFEKSTARDCALKLVDLEVVNDEVDVIQKEIKVMSEISNHHVVKYYTSFMEESTLWIVMEYLAGGSLKELVDSEGPMPEEAIAYIVLSLVRGLKYIHGQKKVHRDIKAANVLLSASGEVKLADFGVAGQMTATVRQRCTFTGSPFWMAPEVIMESQYNEKADIWSLGITAIELATGLPPLAEENPYRAIMTIPKRNPPRLTGPKYSKPFQDFVEACLHKNARDRASATTLESHPFLRKAKSAFVKNALKRRKELDQLRNLKTEGSGRGGDSTPSMHGSLDSSMAGSVLGSVAGNEGGSIVRRPQALPSKWDFDSVDGLDPTSKDSTSPVKKETIRSSPLAVTPVLMSTSSRGAGAGDKSVLPAGNGSSPVSGSVSSAAKGTGGPVGDERGSSATDAASRSASPSARTAALASPDGTPRLTPRSELTKSAPVGGHVAASTLSSHGGTRLSSPSLGSRVGGSTVLSDLVLPVIMQMRADVATRGNPDEALMSSLGTLEVAFADAETARPGVCATIVESLFSDALAARSGEIRALVLRALRQHDTPELASGPARGMPSDRRPPSGSPLSNSRSSSR